MTLGSGLTCLSPIFLYKDGKVMVSASPRISRMTPRSEAVCSPLSFPMLYPDSFFPLFLSAHVHLKLAWLLRLSCLQWPGSERL